MSVVRDTQDQEEMCVRSSLSHKMKQVFAVIDEVRCYFVQFSRILKNNVFSLCVNVLGIINLRGHSLTILTRQGRLYWKCQRYTEILPYNSKGVGQLISKGHFGVFKSAKSQVNKNFVRISSLDSKKRLNHRNKGTCIILICNI